MQKRGEKEKGRKQNWAREGNICILIWNIVVYALSTAGCSGYSKLSFQAAFPSCVQLLLVGAWPFNTPQIKCKGW